MDIIIITVYNIFMNITFISDTHNREPVLPGGDLLIHCGDLTQNGFKVEVIKQLNYLHEQLDKYKYIIIIPGNHDLWCERHPSDFRDACLSAGIISLINESIEIEGFKIFGSPNSLRYHDWAFNSSESDLFDIYDKIPADTDILVTHGPPLGVLDQTTKGSIGSSSLKDAVDQLKPKIHAFGHIHEDGGKTLTVAGTQFINCATKIINITIIP